MVPVRYLIKENKHRRGKIFKHQSNRKLNLSLETYPQSVWKSEKRLTICSSRGRCGPARVLRN